MIDKHYKELGIDTIQLWRANHTDSSMLDVCDFMISKYVMRNKGCDYEDYLKIQAYAEVALNILREQDLEISKMAEYYNES